MFYCFTLLHGTSGTGTLPLPFSRRSAWPAFWLSWRPCSSTLAGWNGHGSSPQDTSTSVPRDFALRITSNRVFAWFGGYPNALAGYLVIAFAPTLAWIWARAGTWPRSVRWFTILFVGAVLIYCLVLTGSRGGVLAFIVVIFVGLFGLLKKGARLGIAAGAAGLILAGIILAAHERRLLTFGSHSLGSRTDYWRGASAIARDHFWLGTGPGTFGSVYLKYKQSHSEEAQLVHNNYLEMWSDSGFLAFVLYAGTWSMALTDCYRLVRHRQGDLAGIAVFASLSGAAVHSLVDFDLYIRVWPCPPSF